MSTDFYDEKIVSIYSRSMSLLFRVIATGVLPRYGQVPLREGGLTFITLRATATCMSSITFAAVAFFFFSFVFEEVNCNADSR